MVKQGRNIVSFMSIVAHARDNNTREKAEASFEESDPRDWRRIGIVAVARKLLIALWRFLETGELPEGAAFKVG